jgi:hypothetical protein
MDSRGGSTDAETRRTWLWRFWPVASAFLLARYLIGQRGSAVAWWDTTSYSPRPGQPHHGELVSLTGHAPRLWGSPALFALFHSDQTRAWAQSAIGALAWLTLAWVVWRIPRNGAVRLAASGALLLLGLTTQATSWDFAILSESLSISLGLLVLAGLLWWLHERSQIGLALLTVAGLWWTFIRPEIRLMVVAVIAGLWIFASRHRVRWRPTAIASGVLVLAVVWCSLIVPNTNKAFARSSAVPGGAMEEEIFYHQLRSRIYPDERLQQIYEVRLGMPPCPGAARMVRDAAPDSTEFGKFVTAVHSCPRLVDWIRTKSNATSLRFPLIAPVEFSRVIGAAMPRTWAGAAWYGHVPQVLPGWLALLIFPPSGIAMWCLAGAVLVAFGAAVLTGQWRRRRALFACCVGVVATAIVSPVAGLIYASTEFERQGIQETLLLRICVVVLLALAADEVVRRIQRSAAGRRPLGIAERPGLADRMLDPSP